MPVTDQVEHETLLKFGDKPTMRDLDLALKKFMSPDDVVNFFKVTAQQIIDNRQLDGYYTVAHMQNSLLTHSDTDVDSELQLLRRQLFGDGPSTLK